MRSATSSSFRPSVHADLLYHGRVEATEVNDRRLAAVEQRELALARRAAELSARERALGELERALHEQARELIVKQRALETLERAVHERLEAVVQQPETEPAEAPEGEEALSTVTLYELESLVATRRDAEPESVEEWNDYLYHLREFAQPDGRLPARFDGLIEDVFGPLLGR